LAYILKKQLIIFVNFPESFKNRKEQTSPVIILTKNELGYYLNMKSGFFTKFPPPYVTNQATTNKQI